MFCKSLYFQKVCQLHMKLLNCKNTLIFKTCLMKHKTAQFVLSNSTIPSCQLQAERLQWVVQAECHHLSQHYYTDNQPVKGEQNCRLTSRLFSNLHQKIHMNFSFCKCLSNIFVSYILWWHKYTQVLVCSEKMDWTYLCRIGQKSILLMVVRTSN